MAASSASCVQGTPSLPQRLNGPEAVVVIVIVTVASVLAIVSGLPVLDVLQLVAGAGLVAVLVVALATGAPTRAVRTALRAVLTSAPAA
ncbi:hypothetical protein [Streptomyces sp. NPDC048295]|uniref:hypothetical protein n=1 Tax=Streptomyces sp. NPDC048295 TaxID=3154617 RepID=UPI00342A0EFE